MAILIIHRTRKIPDYYKWLAGTNEELILFMRKTSTGDLSGYAKVREFDHFDSDELIGEVMQLHQQTAIRFIVALAEEDIIIAGRLRSLLNIPGQDAESAIAYRNKVVMKKFVSSQNIKCPHFKELHELNDLYQFIDDYGNNVVVKPKEGYGSLNTYIIRNEAELIHTVHEISEHNLDEFMVETFVPGEMVSVNGLAVDDKIKFCSVNKYAQGCAEFKEGINQLITTVSHQDKLYIQARQFTENIIQALPSPQVLVFHCELFHQNGQFVFCEIASRPSGGWICDAIQHSHGINLKEKFVKISCGIRETLEDIAPTVLAGIYFIPVQEGTLQKQLADIPIEWVKQYIPVTQPGTYCQAAADCVDIVGVILFVGENDEELLEKSNILKEYIKEQIQWN
ncbi:ATP-grasp domain-containing protein [Paenibacillus barengoltzii]|uniref:ATP-grasp domain-containing protein n=1 Tax=Paenibacillus barengoltzii TaxID=343517 RepID=UPI002DB9A5AF|nr:ATP-grasp domain-containing protein [Paenibacillus barengoltzii]MEC2346815.1 ATP-grasp domain-containing protein [Paenibacillus barengoltzii]